MSIHGSRSKRSTDPIRTSSLSDLGTFTGPRSLLQARYRGPHRPASLTWKDGQSHLPFKQLAALAAELLAVQLPPVSWALIKLPLTTAKVWKDHRARNASMVFARVEPRCTGQLAIFPSRVSKGQDRKHTKRNQSLKTQNKSTKPAAKETKETLRCACKG